MARAQIATVVQTYRPMADNLVGIMPSYVGVALQQLIAACDRWEADERDITKAAHV